MPKFPDLNKSLREVKIEALCEIEGESREKLMERAVFDGVSAGICVNKDCDFTTEIEPDSDSGWCEECSTNTIWSILMLAGII